MSGPFARPLPGSLDLVWRLLGPLHARVADALAAIGMPAMVGDAVVELIMWGEFVLVALAVTRITQRLRASGPISGPSALAAALVALGLIAWTLRHSTTQLHELFIRPDHLLLAGAAGVAVEPLPGAARRLLLAGLSTLFLVHSLGVLALAVVGGGGLAGFGIAHVVGRARRALLIASQVMVVAAVLGVCFWLRGRGPALAMAVHGLAFFVLLRHISWAAEFSAGATATAIDYCFYLLFYPGASGIMGAPEVFAEFRQRNLGRPVLPDAEMVWRLLRGAACVWLSRRIPVSFEAVAASTDALTLWALQAAYWVEVALYLMGVWMIVDGIALLLGVRLRQNFAHLLGCENPSDLWRSVRGTMTYWLVYHVYRPLGGNRGSQELHVMAALAVSLVWHLISVPFLAFPVRLLHFAPFTLWALINGVALIGHVYVRRHGWRVLPAATPVWLRRAIHRVLTLLLASLVMLPNFQFGPNVNGFLPYVRTLFGLGAQ